MQLKYTIEQEEELKLYALISGDTEREDFILKFMQKHDKSSRSLIAKLSKMQLYKARPKMSTVTGEKAETKKQMVGKIARNLGVKEDELEGLDKSPKLTLVRLLKRLNEQSDAS